MNKKVIKKQLIFSTCFIALNQINFSSTVYDFKAALLDPVLWAQQKATFKQELENPPGTPGMLSPEDLQCDGMSITGIDSSDMCLRDASFIDCIFSNVDLTNTDFTNANLHNLKLISTAIGQAILTGANIARIKFDNTYRLYAYYADPTRVWNHGVVLPLALANISKQSFFQQFINGRSDMFNEMKKGELDQLCLQNYNLKNAYLKGAEYDEYTFNVADCKNMNISSSTLSNTVFVNCDLTWADFSGSNFTNVTFTSCNLQNANLDNIQLPGGIVIPPNCTNSDLQILHDNCSDNDAKNILASIIACR